MAGAVCVIVWGAHAPWYHKAANGSIIMRRFRIFLFVTWANFVQTGLIPVKD